MCGYVLADEVCVLKIKMPGLQVDTKRRTCRRVTAVRAMGPPTLTDIVGKQNPPTDKLEIRR